MLFKSGDPIVRREGIAIGFDIARLHQPFARYFRSKRFRRFADAFGLSERTRVLDVGGSSYYWEFFELLPKVTIVNLERPPVRDERFQWVVADARRLPFRKDAFDVCFSNSVVEHIPGIDNQRAYAAEVARVGRTYYVQTPYRWFPVEPHLMTPLIHYLPRSCQRPLLMNFTVWGILQRPTPQGCDDFLRDVHLLTVSDLRALFPGADLWKERTLGLLKSISAVRL